MINLAGDFDIFIEHVLARGLGCRTYRVRIGGALWHTLEAHGLVGLAKDGLDTDMPDRILAPIAGVMGFCCVGQEQAFPVISTDPGTITDELNGFSDRDAFDVDLRTDSLDTLKTWSEAFNGTYEPCPVRRS